MKVESARIIRLPKYLFDPISEESKESIAAGWPPCNICGGTPADDKHARHLWVMRSRFFFQLTGFWPLRPILPSEMRSGF